MITLAHREGARGDPSEWKLIHQDHQRDPAEHGGSRGDGEPEFFRGGFHRHFRYGLSIVERGARRINECQCTKVSAAKVWRGGAIARQSRTAQFEAASGLEAAPAAGFGKPVGVRRLLGFGPRGLLVEI